jgi:hypothetical protein
MATTSHNWAQSRSRHRTGIVTTVHLQTTQSPISAHTTIDNIKKTHFLPFKPCLLGAVFCSHRRAHMRACSLHRRAYMCACTLNRCASVRTCLLHRHTLTRACSPYRRAPVRACQTYRRALMRACSTHRHALRAHLKFPLSCTHSRIISVQACTHARLSPSRPRMGGPHPLHTPVRPPVQTLPKN